MLASLELEFFILWSNLNRRIVERKMRCTASFLFFLFSCRRDGAEWDTPRCLRPRVSTNWTRIQWGVGCSLSGSTFSSWKCSHVKHVCAWIGPNGGHGGNDMMLSNEMAPGPRGARCAHENGQFIIAMVWANYYAPIIKLFVRANDMILLASISPCPLINKRSPKYFSCVCCAPPANKKSTEKLNTPYPVRNRTDPHSNEHRTDLHQTTILLWINLNDLNKKNSICCYSNNLPI